MDLVRFGIIGAGGIATHFHLPAVAKCPGAKLVAVADVLENRARLAADKFGAQTAYTDYHDLLERSDLDAVIVATRHPLHSPIGIEVLESGKHLLIQKPMATKQEDADRLVDTLRATGKTAMALPYSQTAIYRKALELVNAGAIGRVVMARARVAHAGPGPITSSRFGEAPSKLWFYDKAQADGGALFDMGVYAISALAGLVGPISRVSARITTIMRDVDVDENALLAVDFRNGAIGSIETSWCQQAGDESISLYGSEGTIYIRPQLPAPPESGQKLMLFSKKASGPAETNGWVTVNVPVGEPSIAEAHAHFVQCLLDGTKPIATVEQGRHVVEVMLGAYRSSETGQLVEVKSEF